MNAALDPAASPEQFVAELRASGRRRAAFFLNPDTGRLEACSSEFAELGHCMSDNTRDFAQHEGVFLEVGTETGALLAAFLHRTARGQAAGGVRHWRYESLQTLLNDGLRLSRGMGRKNSLAGLWWGGGKGIIAAQSSAVRKDALYRGKLYRDYGRFVTQLRGAYVTAEDVGTNASDMAAVFETTRFVTCIPSAIGGSGNPSQATARGVVAAMEAALLFRMSPELSLSAFKEQLGVGRTLDPAITDSSLSVPSVLTGKRIIMQGMGNVARFMIGYLLERGVSQIVAADISHEACVAAREEHPDPRVVIRQVAPEDRSIFSEPGDVFAPNALGGIITRESIPLLRTGVVCGAANNQLLEDSRDAALLRDRNIVFVPDFVANRMGIVQCANEQYGSLPDDPAILRHFDPSYDNAIQRVVWRILTRAAEEGTTPTAAANELADELSEQAHPIWPGRAQQLIRSLRNDGWHRG